MMLIRINNLEVHHIANSTIGLRTTHACQNHSQYSISNLPSSSKIVSASTINCMIGKTAIGIKGDLGWTILPNTSNLVGEHRVTTATRRQQ